MVITPSLVLSALSLLPKTYHAYRAVVAIISEWKESDKDLTKLGIRFEIAYSDASYHLDQLAIVPDRSEVEIAASEREIDIRRRCIDVVEDLMLQSVSAMEGLVQQQGKNMKAQEKVMWLSKSKEILTKAVDQLDEWNEYASRVCVIKVKHLYKSYGEVGTTLPYPSLPIDVLARMAIARAEAIAKPSITDSIWIDQSVLAFDENDDSQSRSRASSWKTLVNHVKTQKSANLKFLPRRFGVLKQAHISEQVMVEFRPYAVGLAKAMPGEYMQMRNQILQLGWTLHSATTFNSTSKLPLVPFLGVSELPNASPPCFLLIYRGHNLEALFSMIKSYARERRPAPSPVERLHLAVHLAKAVFSLHRTGYVHGGLTTDSIFLHCDRVGDTLEPLLAGFEIARLVDAHTNKLDVTDRDLALYLHPNRLPGGVLKDSNYPPYDVCALGVILLEVGLWVPLRYMKGMRKDSDHVRREKVYKASHKLAEAMSLEYQNVVKYCLEGYVTGACAPAGGVASEARAVSFGDQNAAEVVARLEPIVIKQR